MKRIQHIAFASILALALSASAFAGDIGVGKSGNKPGDIGVGKSGDIGVGKAGSISVELIGIIQTLMNIIP